MLSQTQVTGAMITTKDRNAPTQAGTASKSCVNCNEIFQPGSRITEFDGKLFHPKCFTCSDCKKAITEQFYPVAAGGYLCKPCYFTRFPKKTCCKCKGSIDTAGISFNNENYHNQCFRCENCHKSIEPQSLITVMNSEPCCEDCYGQMYAKVCVSCKKHIASDVEYLEYDDQFWHKDCFICAKCKRGIAEESFYLGENDDTIICQNCV